MAELDSFVDYLLDQLREFGAVPRSMFGGTALYRGEAMFGFAYKECIYFKVDARNRPDYEAVGSEVLVYAPDKKAQQVTSLMEVPPHIIEDPDELYAWATRAVEAALAARRNRKR